MKAILLAVVAVGALVAAAVRADEAPKKELEKFTGSWSAVAVAHDGKKVPEEEVKKMTLTVKGEGYTLHVADQAIEGKHKLDPTKKPKQIDAVRTKGPHAGETIKGIYELDADTFKVCFAPVGKDRPTEFATKEGDGCRLMTFRREKP
jgi:uncharacterized protein (TIGR03067 family)